MRSIRQLIRSVNSEPYAALNIRHELGFLGKGGISPRLMLDLEDNFGWVCVWETSGWRFIRSFCRLISFPQGSNIRCSNIQQDLLLGCLMCPHAKAMILVTKNLESIYPALATLADARCGSTLTLWHLKQVLSFASPPTTHLSYVIYPALSIQLRQLVPNRGSNCREQYWWGTLDERIFRLRQRGILGTFQLMRPCLAHCACYLGST